LPCNQLACKRIKTLNCVAGTAPDIWAEGDKLLWAWTCPEISPLGSKRIKSITI